MHRTDLLLLTALLSSIASSDPAIDTPAYFLDRTIQNFDTLQFEPSQTRSYRVTLYSPRIDATPNIRFEFYNQQLLQDLHDSDTGPILPATLNMRIENQDNELYSDMTITPGADGIASFQDIMIGCRDTNAFFVFIPSDGCTINLIFEFQAVAAPQQLHWGAMLFENRSWDDCDEDEEPPDECRTSYPGTDLEITGAEL
jgi:hypothetical protein